MLLILSILPKSLLACWLAFAGVSANSQAARPPCTLEMAVYDPTGGRLPVKVTRVSVKDGSTRIELLGNAVDGIAVTSSGDKVLFSSDRIVGKRPLDVALEGPGGKRISSQVFVTACQQRRSLFLGESDSGLDVAFVSIAGRLSGCQLAGDWWVRAVPMFGGHDGTTAEDGYVGPHGAFSLQVAPVGVRRILVIGQGRQPVKSIGFDVTLGRSQDLGRVDLAGSCPQ
jgi:hypothetical protein